QVNRIAPNTPLFTADLVETGLLSHPDRVQYTADWLQERHIVALSALGNPSAFEALLSALGAVVVTAHRFRDHQAITSADLERVFAEAQTTGAEAVVTTEKD